MKNKEEQILEKYTAGTATEEEKALISEWILFGKFPELKLSEKDINASLSRIEQRLPVARVMKRVKLWPRIAAAAAIILITTIGLYLYNTTVVTKDFNQLALQNKIMPGNNKAILTLNDGTQINLSDAKNGSLAMQGDVKISKLADGQVIYEFAHVPKTATGYNTLSTPNGGQYLVLLPDGSKVWLNAASSLKFPVSFASLTARKVELSGEAYFEIAKDKKHPFLVSSIGQVVEVLGTHFDVNAYGDGGKLKTTLIEGSVNVKPLTSKSGERWEVMLKPNQQSVLINGSINIVNVDADESIAWKNGYFMFNNESLENIMLNISRWYDVDIEFQDQEIKDDPFWGKVSRFAKVGDVLKVLERTGAVHFQIEGRKIIVSR
jgi:transmembrane sensor